MADQAINALPTKTAPTTGDKMLMIGAAEEYQIDYDQLATAILNKLTSKTFTLDQGTKSLVAALNELNSNTKKITQELGTNIILEHNKHIVTIRININPQILSVGWNQVATIPEGFAPSGAINFVLLNNNSTSESTNTPVFGRIGTNGVINVYSFTEKSCAPTGIVTYII